MKTKHFFIFLMLLVFAGICAPLQKVSAQGGSVSFQVFYDELSPYGTWVITPDYGYVWVPDVDPGFTPYATNGYWICTNMGWTWVSNYQWGWVTWRRSGGYYGWAPIRPGVSSSPISSSRNHSRPGTPIIILFEFIAVSFMMFDTKIVWN